MRKKSNRAGGYKLVGLERPGCLVVEVELINGDVKLERLAGLEPWRWISKALGLKF